MERHTANIRSGKRGRASGACGLAWRARTAHARRRAAADAARAEQAAAALRAAARQLDRGPVRSWTDNLKVGGRPLREGLRPVDTLPLCRRIGMCSRSVRSMRAGRHQGFLRARARGALPGAVWSDQAAFESGVRRRRRMSSSRRRAQDSEKALPARQSP